LICNLLIHYQKPRFAEVTPVDFLTTKPFLEQLIVDASGYAVGTETLVEHTWSYGNTSRVVAETLEAERHCEMAKTSILRIGLSRNKNEFVDRKSFSFSLI
jgi:hypothetical protein